MRTENSAHSEVSEVFELSKANMSENQQQGLLGSSSSNTAASRWKEMHGERSWEGLLRPALDVDLRRTVIWYGEMAQATYDAFNHERVSPNAGLSRFRRGRFFHGAMLPDHAGAYKVTRFLYATSSAPGHAAAFMVRGRGGHVSWRAAAGGHVSGGGCRESNWIGYVAVATEAGKAALGRRDIVVAWRGTVESLEWVDDLEFAMVAPRGIVKDGCEDALVHRGWLSMYTSTHPASSHNKDSARDQVT